MHTYVCASLLTNTTEFFAPPFWLISIDNDWEITLISRWITHSFSTLQIKIMDVLRKHIKAIRISKSYWKSGKTPKESYTQKLKFEGWGWIR